MTPKGQRVFKGNCDLLYDPKGHGDHLLSVWPSLWPKNVTGSLKVAVTYFMTPKVTVTYGQFDLVYDPKMSQAH